MQKDCSRCKVFASRAAKPACRPVIFPGRPDRLLFHHFISIGFQSGGFCISGCQSYTSAEASHLPDLFCISAANPACQLTFFACWAASPTRPPHPSISQRFVCISDRQSCMSAQVFACRPNASPHCTSIKSLMVYIRWYLGFLQG